MSREIMVRCVCEECGRSAYGTVAWVPCYGPRRDRYIYEGDRHMHRLPEGWRLIREGGRFKDICPSCFAKKDYKEPTLGEMLAEAAEIMDNRAVVVDDGSVYDGW